MNLVQTMDPYFSFSCLSIPLFSWVLYEKPNFKGEKIALDEGDIELTYPFDAPEEEEEQQQKQNGVDGQKEGGEEVVEAKPVRRFIIGSVRRVVRVRRRRRRSHR